MCVCVCVSRLEDGQSKLGRRYWPSLLAIFWLFVANFAKEESFDSHI